MKIKIFIGKNLYHGGVKNDINTFSLSFHHHENLILIYHETVIYQKDHWFSTFMI